MSSFSWVAATIAVFYAPIFLLGANLWTPRTIPWADRWMFANVLIFIGLVSREATSVAGSWLIVAENMVFFAAMIVALEGNRQFRGLRPRVPAAYVGGVVASIIVALLVNAPKSRAAAAQALFGILAALNAPTLLRRIPAGYKFGSLFTGGAFALLATLNCGRAIYGQFLRTGPPGTFDQLASMAGLILIACCSIGWLVLIGEGRWLDLQAAEGQARAMAERAAAADRAKSEYARMIGHEIRNPLSGFIITTELLLETPLNSEQRDCILRLRSAVEALVRMTDDVLDLSNLETGSLAITTARFDLPILVADIVKMFEPAARSRGVDFVVECSAMPSEFIGDAGRIRQVIVNLVTNSLKFTSRGYIMIRAQCEARVNSIARVRFAVTDTGAGISPEKITEIRERASAVQSQNGHGIGLAISRKLIERMGGALHVESQMGKGTQFAFVLPLQIAEYPPPDTETFPHGSLLPA